MLLFYSGELSDCCQFPFLSSFHSFIHSFIHRGLLFSSYEILTNDTILTTIEKIDMSFFIYLSKEKKDLISHFAQ